MLVNEAIAFAEQELKRSNNLNSRLDSEILVSHLINIPRESIYSKLKENLPSNKTEELQNLVSRRVKKEPIAYILNNKEFWSTNFYVDRSVLIPRPETEVLIDLILSQISNKNNYLNILDIGTGDRSERIRTYNFPQGRVTDHRINMTLYKLTDFLAGDAFKELSDAIQIQFQEEQLENLKI